MTECKKPTLPEQRERLRLVHDGYWAGALTWVCLLSAARYAHEVGGPGQPMVMDPTPHWGWLVLLLVGAVAGVIVGRMVKMRAMKIVRR